MTWKGGSLKTPWSDSVTCRCFARASLCNLGDGARAIEILQATTPYELGASRGLFGALYPIYVRGEAHLAAHQGPEAATEFQRILDHRGIVGSDPIGALTQVQLGRAFALSGDTIITKTAYQDFLTLWKDPDPNIAILNQARSGYTPSCSEQRIPASTEHLDPALRR